MTLWDVPPQKAKEASGGFIIALALDSFLLLVSLCNLHKRESEDNSVGRE